VRDEGADGLDAYMGLKREEVARLVLSLIIEEALRQRLALFRAEDLATQPVERLEELGVAGLHVMPVGDALR
jgi:hypothetical protein